MLTLLSEMLAASPHLEFMLNWVSVEPMKCGTTGVWIHRMSMNTLRCGSISCMGCLPPVPTYSRSRADPPSPLPCPTTQVRCCCVSHGALLEGAGSGMMPALRSLQKVCWLGEVAWCWGWRRGEEEPQQVQRQCAGMFCSD